MNRIKVLQLLTFDALAGTELMTLNVVRHLSRQHLDVYVAVFSGRGPLAAEYERLGVPYLDLNGHRRVWHRIAALFRLLKRQQFDIIHVYGFRVSVVARLLTRLLSPDTLLINGVRGLHVVEGEDPRQLRTRVALTIERILGRQIDHYVANSQGAVRFLAAHGIPESKLVYIPNGLAVSEWSERDFSQTNEVPVIVCAARFIPRKRHTDLLKALALVARRGLDFHCVLAGDGPTRPRMEALAAHQGIASKVHFAGTLSPSAVRRLLYDADLFVLTSLWEGMPGSVIEAMAAGLPVVGTDANGTNELVVHGVTGYLVPCEQPNALAEHLALLLSRPDLRLDMGRAGRRRVLEEFRIDLVARRTEEFYLSLVEPRVASAASG